MLTQTQSPIRSRINNRHTDLAIKAILADGTPAWISRPQDFKQWARECYLKEKEESDRQSMVYRHEEQDTLTDEKARLVGWLDSREFISKLRVNGIKCFTYQIPPSPNTPSAMVNTVGLWCVVPGQEQLGHIFNGSGHQYMTWLDIPAMPEWSVLRLDAHNIPIGEKYRGWRTVIARLVMRKIFTEVKANLIFGEPRGATSKIYKRTLYDFRNGRIKLNERPEINS